MNVFDFGRRIVSGRSCCFGLLQGLSLLDTFNISYGRKHLEKIQSNPLAARGAVNSETTPICSNAGRYPDGPKIPLSRD